MKEIKFRVFDKVSGKVSESFALFGEFTLLGAVFAWIDHVRGNSKERSGLESLNDLIILQYTGLKDKNGVEIYEGDILAKKSLYESQGFGLQVVEHEKKDVNKCFGHGSFGDNAFSGFEISSYYGNPRELEVIGSVHVNPELMSKSK